MRNSGWTPNPRENETITVQLPQLCDHFIGHCLTKTSLKCINTEPEPRASPQERDSGSGRQEELKFTSLSVEYSWNNHDGDDDRTAQFYMALLSGDV